VKLKATPADFIVAEESSIPLSQTRGRYAIFRLAKRSWDTFDLVDLLARRLGVERGAIGVGGMKDRYGATEQSISVSGLRGRPAAIEEANFTLEFEGWSEAPVSAIVVRGNRFTITLRDLGAREADRIRASADEVSRDGIPNYYDEQRFGSARHGAGFMGKEIFLGRREKALRLYFTPSKHDDQKTRKLKRCVIENWQRWDKCAGMGFGEYGRVLACLAEHHLAWHKALERIDRRLLVFVLNAYQSYLFNEVLARWLRELAPERGFALRSVRYAHGSFEFFESLPRDAARDLHAAVLPVPGYDTKVADARVGRIVKDVLDAEGIGLADLRVRQMHGIHVGGVPRGAVMVPEDLAVEAPEPDDRYPGKLKTTLRFFLPRGSYATLVIKRLSAQ
jgi:tRNA pseudouridine13 synthase